MSKDLSFTDVIILAFIMLIGLTETIHLLNLFADVDFSATMMIPAVAALGGIFTLSVFGVVRVFMDFRKWRMPDVVFLLILISQIAFLLFGGFVYRQNDMTPETVRSFLQTQGVYLVNPLTGAPYTTGIPTRYKILCLPSLYASLCGLLSVDAAVMVRKIVPLAVLVLSYVSFRSLGNALFSEDEDKRKWFLVVVAGLFWVESYAAGMDGYGLLFAGWIGTTIRNTVLVPYTFSLCLRKKYGMTVLCILAEACIAWTFYGLGVSVLIAAGMFTTDLFRNSRHQKEAQV